MCIFFLQKRRHPVSTRSDTPFPFTKLFQSAACSTVAFSARHRSHVGSMASWLPGAAVTAPPGAIGRVRSRPAARAREAAARLARRNKTGMGFSLSPISVQGPGQHRLPPRRDPIELLRQGKIVRCERSEEHTSELQSLMRISYAVFCLKKKKTKYKRYNNTKNKIKVHHTTH